MSALANHPFAKMNGIGNEIVVVDLRDKPAAVTRGRGARRRLAAGGAFRPADGAAAAAARRHRGLHPHLQQRRLGSRRLRQRHALRGPAAVRGDRPDRADVRDPRRAVELLAGAVDGSLSPSTWARRNSAGRRFRSPRSFATRAYIELQIGPIDAPVLHSPSAVNMGNPHAIFWVDDVNAYDLDALRAAAGKPSDLPRARQHHAGPDRRSRSHHHAHLGARRRPDQGLRLGRLRHRGRGGAAEAHQPHRRQ